MLMTTMIMRMMGTMMMMICRTPSVSLYVGAPAPQCPTVHSLPKLSRPIKPFYCISWRLNVSVFVLIRVFVGVYFSVFVLVYTCPHYLQLSCHSAFLSRLLSFPYVPLCVPAQPYLSYLCTCSTIHQLFWIASFDASTNKSSLRSGYPDKNHPRKTLKRTSQDWQRPSHVILYF